MHKAIWLRKPGHFDEMLLHTVKYRNSGKTEVFFILGESGKATLSFSSSSASVSFVFLHTPSDTFVISGSTMVFSFFTLEGRSTLSRAIEELTVIKNGEEVVFLEREEEIMRLRNSAFLSSVSFGFRVEGEGEVVLSVW